MPPLLELSNVSVRREGRTILDAVTFSLEEGEHVAILGPNGCGKSTLLRVLRREIYPFAGLGTVKILGEPHWHVRELRKKIGIVSPDPGVQPLGKPTGWQMAVSGLLGTYGVTEQHDVTTTMRDMALRALDQFDALRLADQAYETMSAGEQRRCLIARALVSEPQVLALDEPTSGLDLVAASQFMASCRRLAQAGTSLILVTHHFDEIVPEIQRVMLLQGGRMIADGSLDDVMTSELLSQAFGARLTPGSSDSPSWRVAAVDATE